MVQKTSPFVETKYGWSFGESGWNSGMDENLLKFSFLFDSNIDAIVSELPPPVNGRAYFYTVDKRVYFVIDGTYLSLLLPKWYLVTINSTGESFQFDGTDIYPVKSVDGLDVRLGLVEEELSTLGTAAFAEVSDFATPANLDIVEANSQSYTDSKFTDLANDNGEMVGYLSPLTTAVARNIRLKLAEFVSVKDFGAVGDGVADDTAAIQACIDAIGALMDGVVFFPTGKYRITTSLNLTNGKVSLKGSSSNRNDSVIIGDTGENFAIDMTGSDNRWTSIEDLYLVSDASQANPTVNGLLLARTVAASLAGESYFKNFRINLISAPTANNGYGSVGVASIGSESNKFSQLFVAADAPFYSNAAPELIEFSAGAKVVVKNITSIYKTIDPAGASNTENQIDGILLSRSTNLARSALFINSGASWHMNVFISRLSAPSESVTNFATAITLSNCNSMHIEGDVEGFKVPLALMGFNKSHGVKLYTSFSDGYPLIYSKSSITGIINTLDDCDIDIHPTYSSRNAVATFIKSQNVIQIAGGEIKLHCDLDISDVSSNWLRGVLIKNRGGKAIKTNNEQNLSLASSYSEVSPSGLRLFGPDTLINSGFGFNEKTSNYFINTLVDGTVNTRTSREFSTGLSGNNVFVVVKINGEGANAVPFYIERLFMFRRVGTGVAYALHHSETLKNIDPDNVAPTLTTVPTVTSALGAALSFTLAFTIASGGATIGNIAGSCVASGKYP